MKSRKIRILLSVLLIIAISLVSACARDNEDEEPDGEDNDIISPDDSGNNNDIDNGNNNNQNGDEGSAPAPSKPDQDSDLTEMLLNEEEVSDGQIYLRDDWAIGAITLNDNVSRERAQEIAQKYADLIKESYSDKRVNVQVILNGENVANIEL